MQVSAQTITLCADEIGMPPYYQLENDGLSGILVERARNAAKHLGVNLIIKTAPFKRCLLNTMEGKYDGILAAVHTSDRAKQLAYPKTAGTGSLQGATNFASVSMFVKSTSNATWDGNQFHHIDSIISAPKGWWIHSYFQGHELYSENGYSPSKGIELVALGRLSGFIIYDFYGWHVATKLGISDSLRSIAIPEISYPWYMPFNTQFYLKNNELVEKFWDLCADKNYE